MALPPLPPLPAKLVERVTVLLGGPSSEREVSLTSGRACVAALREAGYMVSELDPSGGLSAWTQALVAQRPEVIFNALHGTFGEDGQVQAVLDQLGLTYTHSGMLSSALAMDKPLSKQLFAAWGLTVEQDMRVSKHDVERQGDPLPRPYVLKPAAEGSSVGVLIVQPGDNLDLGRLADFDDLMAEAYVPGRELTVTVMQGKALCVTELRPLSGFYDYEAKYSEGKTEHLCPAPLDSATSEQALRQAELAYAALQCRGMARVDFRFDESRSKGEQLVVLELNTQPGMTPLSLSPEQALARGISFAQLCSWLVEVAAQP